MAMMMTMASLDKIDKECDVSKNRTCVQRTLHCSRVSGCRTLHRMTVTDIPRSDIPPQARTFPRRDVQIMRKRQYVETHKLDIVACNLSVLVYV